MSKDLLQTFLLGIHPGSRFSLSMLTGSLLIYLFLYKWWRRNLLFRVPDRGKKDGNWVSIHGTTLRPKWKIRSVRIFLPLWSTTWLNCRHWATLLYIYWVSLSLTISWEPWGCLYDWRTLPSGKNWQECKRPWKMPHALWIWHRRKWWLS